MCGHGLTCPSGSVLWSRYTLILHRNPHLCLQYTTQGPSADQQEAVRGGADTIREEAKKGSTGVTVRSYACLNESLTFRERHYRAFCDWS